MFCSPDLSIQVILSLKSEFGRRPVPRHACLRELGAYWSTMPERARTRRTDYRLARVLSTVADPVTCLRWWRATGDWRPWLAESRYLAAAGVLDAILGAPDTVGVLDDLLDRQNVGACHLDGTS